jgi:gamma-glutamyltranspeptidase
MQRLVNIVDYGTDPRGALEAPLLLSLAGSPSQLVERVAEGQFDPALLDAVRAMGQPVEEVPLTTEHLVKSRGYWVGILIDPERGTLEGAAPTIFGGTAVGY